MLLMLEETMDHYDFWAIAWDLYSDGRLGTASYAIFPHLVIMAREGDFHPDFFSYGAKLCNFAGEGDNPAIPDFLEPQFTNSIQKTFELAMVLMRKPISPTMMLGVFEFCAAYKGMPKLSAHLEKLITEDIGS
jgi:hypothetical protein